MEARTVLQKIRQRGFIIKAIGNAISLAPKKLVNDRIIGFIKEHKEAILTALYQEEDERQILHRERKRSLNRDRLDVLRIRIRCYLKSGEPSSMIATDYEIEDYIDKILKQHDYDLEDAITTYRNITPEPVLECKCGYLPPFCSCGGIPTPRAVSCSQCANFTPDVIGDGVGIGTCTRGIERTRELNGCISLYRFASRHCAEFSRSENHGIKLS